MLHALSTRGVHTNATICNIRTRIHKMQISLLDIHISIIFLLFASAQLLRLLNVIIIRYPQISSVLIELL
jgi:hypothetical protein